MIPARLHVRCSAEKKMGMLSLTLPRLPPLPLRLSLPPPQNNTVESSQSTFEVE